MNRRNFLATSGAAALPAAAPSPATYVVARVSATAPGNSHTDIGGIFLRADSLRLNASSDILQLKWNDLSLAALGRTPRLRLTMLSNLRNFQRLEIALGNGGSSLGTIDISLATPFQILELALPEKSLPAVLSSGIDIRIAGDGAGADLFAPGGNTPPEFAPSLLVPGQASPTQEFFSRIASRASLTQFGWQSGCILDGLACLAERSRNGARFQKALLDHLELQFPADAPARSFPSTENTAVLAQLARIRPNSPQIQATLDFWSAREKRSGGIDDGNAIVAEGNYSVSWPLAVLAHELKRPELADKAITELRNRKTALIAEDGAIWLRWYRKPDGPPRTYRLWARGIAWYLLGLARTLDALPAPPADLIAELRRASAYLLPLQTPDGMWRVFAAEPDTAPESSGTAGIAAALAIGVRRGWLGKPEARAAASALRGLRSRLTPDGFLTGVSQSNKKEGGEAYQRANKGAILQWGMGLMAQLIAELEPPSA